MMYVENDKVEVNSSPNLLIINVFFFFFFFFFHFSPLTLLVRKMVCSRPGQFVVATSSNFIWLNAQDSEQRSTHRTRSIPFHNIVIDFILGQQGNFDCTLSRTCEHTKRKLSI